MADTKISDLAALAGTDLADTDLVSVVDVSDTTMAASGTNKRMTVTELAIGLQDELSIAAGQVSGLGGAALLSVGTATGTVAAGDDSRITGALQSSAAPELIRDTIGSALVAGSGISITVSDPADTITLATTGSVDPQSGALVFAMQVYAGGW